MLRACLVALVVLVGAQFIFVRPPTGGGGGNLSCADATTRCVASDGSKEYTTIQACANAASAGDTCWVYPGTYTSETVNPPTGGSSDGVRVTFLAQTSGVTLKGFYINHQYITINGFTLTGGTGNNGNVYLYTGGSDTWVLNNTISGSVANEIGVYIVRASGVAANRLWADSNLFDGMPAFAFELNGDDHVITNNTFHNMHQWDPFYIYGSNVVIRRNYFYAAGSVGGGNHPDFIQTFGDETGTTFSSNVLVEGNFVIDLPDQLAQFNSTRSGQGLLVPEFGPYTFRNNVFANVPSNANIQLPSVTFDHNSFYRMAYSLDGPQIGGSLWRGEAKDFVMSSNVLLDGGSTGNESDGYYAVNGFVFNSEVVQCMVTNGASACENGEPLGGTCNNTDAPTCPIAYGIMGVFVSNSWVDFPGNGNILPGGRSVSQATFNSVMTAAGYGAYQATLWTLFQDSISRDTYLKSSFRGKYNYGAGASPTFAAKRAAFCTCGGLFYEPGNQNFCEAATTCSAYQHGVNGGDPTMIAATDPDGADNLPFTSDDGLRPQAGSPLCGAGEWGTDIGAYRCGPIVSAGGNHNLMIKPDGTLWAWGDNTYGQLGDGTTTSYHSPHQIGTRTDWVTVAAGYQYSLAIRSDGSLWAWGRNTVSGGRGGGLGDGTLTDRLSPVQIGYDHRWVSISAGYGSSFGIKSNGTLWSWGLNHFGELCQGDQVDRTAPTQVGSVTTWATVAAKNDTTHALKRDGTLWGCGTDGYGQLGDGATTGGSDSLVQIGSATDWAKLARGYYHTCALKTDASLYCWGRNTEDQVNSTGTNVTSPTQISGTYKAVSPGQYFTMAVKSDGTLWGWGKNDLAQLGVGDQVDKTTPTQIGALTTWSGVEAGWFYGIGWKSGTTLWGWGENAYGQSGGDPASPKLNPTQIIW